MAIADTEPVKKVRQALKHAGLADKVIELAEPVESAEGAAKALETEPGAVVRSKVYAIGKRMVLVLFAGDHGPVEENLPPAFFLEGAVRVPPEAEVKGVTGFAADCVPPAGLAHPLPTVIDRSLKRFDYVFATAGDPQCVVKMTVADLKRLTGGIVSWNIARPLEGEVEVPPLKRGKTFSGERAERG